MVLNSILLLEQQYWEIRMPVPPDQLCQRPHSSAQGGCPYASRHGSQTAALKSYTVHFESLIADNIWRKIVALAKEVCARLSPSSIKSAWYIGTQNDLSQPLLRSWKPGSYVSEFATPAGTVYVTADPVVMRAIFAHPRKAATGIFYDYENTRLFVNGILKDLYPDEIRTIGIEKVIDMLVISAPTPHAAMLRSPMIKALGPSAISAHGTALKSIADGILTHLTVEEKKSCDASILSFEYAVTVISKLFANYETNRKGYQNLAKALDAFSKRMTRIVSHRPATVDEEKEYST
ncbi:MAG TPA: hypothetical protein VGO47_10015, partial [Chlamydiales bacterium]|nr:hypothetical protein [Chlamydiales bacterium]